jgi:D-tyrosyl-tRNA(Tyr) deacylase
LLGLFSLDFLNYKSAMRAVLQRVDQAAVRVDGEVIGASGRGLLIFLGVCALDSLEDVDWLASRIVKLRVFDDGAGKMNRSLLDIDGEVLVISQFTLYGSLKKGNRPSYNRAASPDVAVPLYEAFIQGLSASLGKPVASGRFGADMQIEAHNDGPVTLIVDTKERDF